MSEEADAVPSVDVPLAEDLSSVGGGEDAKTRAAQRKEELRKRQAEAIQRNRGERDEANSEFKPKEETVKADAKPATAPKQKVLRKDQIENAVRFLTHPKVKDSPLGKRIAFLEHKGLNDDEISEALKRANVSAEDIKAAQAQQESQYEAGNDEQGPSPSVESRKGPQLPPRTVLGPSIIPASPPAPPPSQWKAQALTAVLCFGVGTATSLLAAKYLFAPGGLFGQKTDGQDAKPKKKSKKKKRSKAKEMKRELNSLRANQEALNNEMQEAVSSMKTLVELQNRSPTSTVSSRSGLTRSMPVSSPEAKNEEIESLKAELKVLRARILDQTTSGPNIAKGSAVGKAEKPLVAIPPTTITAEGSALPSWMITSQPPVKKSSAAPESNSPTASPNLTPSPPFPHHNDSDDSETTLESEQKQSIVTPSASTTTTTTTTSANSSEAKSPSEGKPEQSSGKRERPPKPYQNKQKVGTSGRTPLGHRPVEANGDNLNINENGEDENEGEGEAAENENVKMQNAEADNLEENRGD